MTAAVVETKPKKAERTRQLLLDAALRIIGRKGYSSATVDEIVKEAGVSKGVAYYHFKSKAALAIGILNKGLDDMTEQFQRIADTSSNAESALSIMLELFASELYDNREFAHFLMTELWRDGRVWSKVMRERVQVLIDIVAAQLARGIEEGTLRESIDPQFSAVSLVGMCVTDAMYYAGLENDPLLNKHAFIEHIRTFAHHALER